MAGWNPPDESRWGELRRPTDDDDRRAYERDCLAHVRHWFENVPEDARHDVRKAWLEGSYPETAICVRWFDRFYKREHTESYRVWGSPGFTAADGGVSVPSTVALLIHTWVHEQQPKPPD